MNIVFSAKKAVEIPLMEVSTASTIKSLKL